MLAHEAFAQRLSTQGCAARAAKLDAREVALTLGADGSELIAAMVGRVASGILLVGCVFDLML
jgi:hypothetical protein